MKQRKMHLDEMQDHKLLRIEEAGFWLLFWALFAAIIVQFLLGAHLKEIAGEAITLFVASIYITVKCLNNGLWGRSYAPNLKTNALASILPAFLLGVIRIVKMLAVNMGQFPLDAIAKLLLHMLLVYAICLIVLEMMRLVYHHRRRQLDDVDDENGGK